MVVKDSWVLVYNDLALTVIEELHSTNGLDFVVNNGKITEVDDNGNTF